MCAEKMITHPLLGKYRKQRIRLDKHVQFCHSPHIPNLPILLSHMKTTLKLATPSYALIDENGKILACNEKACIKKIKELTGN